MRSEADVRPWCEPDPEQLAKVPQDCLHIASVITQCNFLHGKVLTIIDASFSNPSQNKAIKDLIRAEFRERMDWLVGLSNPDNMGIRTPE